MTQRYAPSIDIRNTQQTIFFLYKQNVILRLPNYERFLPLFFKTKNTYSLKYIFHYALFKTLNLQKSPFTAI